MPDSTRQMTETQRRARANAQLRREEIANRCGPESARTVPFDTGTPHGPFLPDARYRRWGTR